MPKTHKNNTKKENYITYWDLKTHTEREKEIAKDNRIESWVIEFSLWVRWTK